MATRTTRGAAAKASAAIPQLAWDAVRPAPIVLVSGTESLLADRAIRRLRDILTAEDPSIEVSDIEADSYAPGELITLASPSLFAERKAEVEAAPDDWRAWFRLGSAYGDAGDTSRGRTAVRRAVRLERESRGG